MNKLYNIKIMKIKEKEFILENYANIGCKKCSEILKIKRSTIYSFAAKNKLKVNKESLAKIISKSSLENWSKHEKKDSDYKVDPSYFINCTTPKSAYILGLLWADGTVYQKGYENRIAIECLEEDVNIFMKYFEESGDWNIYKRKGRISGSGMINLNTNNKKLAEFLTENDFRNKSTSTPNKIISLIPDNIKHYFFRGWVDGDGCFYFNKKRSCRQFYISGAIEQDWSSVSNLFDDMGVKYSICRITNKHSYSCIRVTNKKDINKIGNYIYQEFEIDKIGLNRKFNKLQEIIS